MADHINLHEEIPAQKYSSYSNTKSSENTLQEPVIETIVPVYKSRKEIYL
jgi:hypothetical protein